MCTPTKVQAREPCARIHRQNSGFNASLVNHNRNAVLRRHTVTAHCPTQVSKQANRM